MVLAQYSNNCGGFRHNSFEGIRWFHKSIPSFYHNHWLLNCIHSVGKSIANISCCHDLCNLVGPGNYTSSSSRLVFFFGEKLGVTEIIGIFLIIVGIVILKGFSSDLN